MSVRKAHLQAEVAALRADELELKSFLLVRVRQILEAPHLHTAHGPGSEWASVLEAVDNFLLTRIATAEERAASAEYPITGKSSREMREVRGIISQRWRNTRADDEPIDSSPSEGCKRCGDLVYLLSLPQSTGGHWTIRVDQEGFRHRCEASA